MNPTQPQKSALDSVYDFLGNAAQSAENTVSNTLQNVGNFVSNTAQAGTQDLDKAFQSFSQNWDQAHAQAQQDMGALYNSIDQAYQAGNNLGNNLSQPIVNAVSNAPANLIRLNQTLPGAKLGNQLSSGMNPLGQNSYPEQALFGQAGMQNPWIGPGMSNSENQQLSGYLPKDLANTALAVAPALGPLGGAGEAVGEAPSLVERALSGAKTAGVMAGLQALAGQSPKDIATNIPLGLVMGGTMAAPKEGETPFGETTLTSDGQAALTKMGDTVAGIRDTLNQGATQLWDKVLNQKDWDSYLQTHTDINNHQGGVDTLKDQNGSFAMIPTDQKIVPPQGPNDSINKNVVQQLTENDGLPSPAIVKPNGDGTYQIIDGHHRFPAARALGINQIPAMVLGGDKPLAESYSEMKSIANPDLAGEYQKAQQNAPIVQKVVQDATNQANTQALINQESATNQLRVKKADSAVQSMIAKDKEPSEMNDFVGARVVGTPEQLKVAQDVVENHPLVSEVAKKEHVVNKATGYEGDHYDVKTTANDQHEEIQFLTPEQAKIQADSHDQYKNEQLKTAEKKEGVDLQNKELSPGQHAEKVLRNAGVNATFHPLDNLSEEADSLADKTSKSDFKTPPVSNILPPQKIGFLEKIKPVIDRLASQGGVGQLLANLVIKKIDLETDYAGRYIAALKPLFDLSKKEFDNAWLSREGLAQPISDKVSQALSLAGPILDEIGQKAVRLGLSKGFLQNYMPHSYPKDFFEGQNFTKAIERLVNSGQAKNQEDAVNKLFYMMKNQGVGLGKNKIVGNFAFSREADLSGYEISKKVLVSYLNSVSKTFAEHETYGEGRKVVNTLMNQLAQQGGDLNDAMEMFSIANREKKYDEFTKNASNQIRGLMGATTLSKAVLSHTVQPANIATVGGVIRTLTNIPGAIFSKDQVGFAEKSGVLLDNTLRDMREAGGMSGVLGKVTAPGLNIWLRFTRTLAANVGRDYAIDIAQKAVQGDEKATNILTKMGMNAQDVITRGGQLSDFEQRQAARWMTKTTVGNFSPDQLPGFMDSPGGKLLTQFSAPQYFQTKFIINQVIKPALAGDLVPLATFALLGSTTAFAGVKAADMITHAFGGQSSTQGSLAERTLEKMFGLPVSKIAGAIPYSPTELQPKGALDLVAQEGGNILGPTIGSGLQLTSDTIKAGEGNKEPLEKFALGHVPLVGPTLANLVIPPYNPSAYTLAKQAADEQFKPDTNMQKQLDFLLLGSAKGGPDSQAKAQILLKDAKGDNKLVPYLQKLYTTQDSKDPLWSQPEEVILAHFAQIVDPASADRANLRLAIMQKYGVNLNTLSTQYGQFVGDSIQQQQNQQATSQAQTSPVLSSVRNMLGLNPPQSSQPASDFVARPPTPYSKLTPDQQQLVDAHTASPTGSPQRRQLAALINQQLPNYFNDNAQYYKDNPNTNTSPLDTYLQGLGITPVGAGGGGSGSSSYRSRSRSSYVPNIFRSAYNKALYGKTNPPSGRLKIKKPTAKGSRGLKTASAPASFRPLNFGYLKGLRTSSPGNSSRIPVGKAPKSKNKAITLGKFPMGIGAR